MGRPKKPKWKSTPKKWHIYRRVLDFGFGDAPDDYIGSGNSGPEAKRLIKEAIRKEWLKSSSREPTQDQISSMTSMYYIQESRLHEFKL